MTNKVVWEPGHSVGNETLDKQHRDILARCNALADCLADDTAEGGRRFLDAFDELMAFARENISHVKAPKRIDFMEELPRHPTGKLYKRLIRDVYWGKRDSKIV